MEPDFQIYGNTDSSSMASNISSVNLLSSSSQAGVPSNRTATIYFSAAYTATALSGSFYPNVTSEFALIQPYSTFNPVAVSSATMNGSEFVVNYKYNSARYGTVAFATRVPVSILAAKG